MALVVEDQLYEVPCVVDDTTLALLVNLPPDFPDEPPVITVSPMGLRHPWIDSDVIALDSVPSSWRTNLGKVVQDIRDEFTQRPPAKRTEPANAEEG